MSTRFFYGVAGRWTDVTGIVERECCYGGNIYIPSGEWSRSQMFTDVLPNVLKQILIVRDDRKYLVSHEDDVVVTPNGPVYIKPKLLELHSRLKFNGNLQEEFPEQIMAYMFISPTAKVLEIGSNIGRNTVIIASKLKGGRLVTLESNKEYIPYLKDNLRLNQLEVEVESSALSEVDLYQKGWSTYRKERAPPDAKQIDTITYKQLMDKYQIEFDTLVADCEGALYYILQDSPQLLDNMKVVIVENDYWEIEQKRVVDRIIREKGFRRVYYRAGGFGPCSGFFYEVWVR